jgi:4-hydroxy 2-oxovalerate aldolase
LNNNKKITFFDCTLREAGYQTGWYFDETFCRDIYRFAQGNGIDYLELGFFHNPGHDPGKGIFRYCSEKQDEIKNLFGLMKNRVKISAMRDIQRPLNPLKPCGDGAVDTIRILTRSHETDMAVLKKQVDEIRSFDYELFINFTSAGYNSMEKNSDFAQFAADEGVPMIYFADTESVMTVDYVIKTIDICHKKGIKVGTHFHDKNGTAEMLMKTALENDTDGLDFTLLGLGGKWLDGNLSLETYLHTFGLSGGFELTALKNELINQLIKYNQYSAAG